MAGPRLTGPKLTAPAAKLLARSISSTSSASGPKSTSLLTLSRATAPISRKYADLLKEKGLDGDHPRHLYTRTAKGRPYPPPRKMRLMQTFTSSAARSAQSDASTIDFAMLPKSFDAPADPYSRIRMPLLPDNYTTQYAQEEITPLPKAEISVVASNPDSVSPSALTEVEGIGMDGVELKFAQEDTVSEGEPSMLIDLWQGLRDDLFGNKGKSAM